MTERFNSGEKARESQPAPSRTKTADRAQANVSIDELSWIWRHLSPSAIEAMQAGVALRMAMGADRLHMEHLLVALYRKAPGPSRYAIDEASLVEEEFLSIVVEASNTRRSWPTRYALAFLDAIPDVSGHVAAALLNAKQRADLDGSDSIRSRHLFFGAMSVEDCAPVAELLRRGVDKQLALDWAGEASSRASQAASTGVDSPPTTPPQEPTPPYGAVPAEALKEQPSPPPPRLTVTASAQTDLPTSIDRLGHDRLVEALAALLNGERTTFPLTIAISAPWGGGKSSVMRLLRNKLITEDDRLLQRAKRRRILSGISAARARSWVIVEFPAWRYETGEQLWAAMAKATYDAALATRRGWRGRAAFRLRLEARRGAIGRVVLRGGAVGLAAVVGAIVGGGIGAAAGTSSETTAIAGGAGGILAVMQALGASLADPFKQSLEAFAKRPSTGDGFTLAAAAQVDALMDLLLENEGRVLIMIDDVDRCTPHNLVRVIEAVSQIFVAGADVASNRSNAARKEGQPEEKPRKLVFLMGMDREFVARGIEVEYADLKKALDQDESYGFSFLDKIIQLWVSLPEPKLDRLRGLLRSVSGDGGQGREMGKSLTPGGQSGSNGTTPVSIAPGSIAVAGGEPPGLDGDDVEPQSPPDDSEEVTEAIEAGAEFLERNPRKVKRYNNAFRLQFHLASQHNDLTKPQLYALARWVAIRLRWEELAKEMDDDPQLLRALEIAANANRTQSAKDRGLLETQQEAIAKWIATDTFADCEDLMKALASPNRKGDISSLPFEEFLRIS